MDVKAINSELVILPAFMKKPYDVSVLESQDVDDVILSVRVKNALNVSLVTLQLVRLDYTDCELCEAVYHSLLYISQFRLLIDDLNPSLLYRPLKKLQVALASGVNRTVRTTVSDE